MAMEKNTLVSGVHNMVTTVGAFLFTKEKVAVQSATKSIVSIVESLVIEFDQ